MQQVLAGPIANVQVLHLPEPETPIWEGLQWGRYDDPLTPAFWASQTWMAQIEKDDDFRLGRTLREEVVYCLLGGYGAPAEVGLAAADRMCRYLESRGSIRPERGDLDRVLKEPLQIGNRSVRYRFASQRAKYLADILRELEGIDEAALSDLELRNFLRTLPGIGPKTASWIVRNRRASDHVAILDVHIVRACAAMGVFPPGEDPSRHYEKLEKRFLEFCSAIKTRASHLDATMWMTMRSVSHQFMQQLIDSFPTSKHPKEVLRNGVGNVGIQRKPKPRRR